MSGRRRRIPRRRAVRRRKGSRWEALSNRPSGPIRPAAPPARARIERAAAAPVRPAAPAEAPRPAANRRGSGQPGSAQNPFASAARKAAAPPACFPSSPRRRPFALSLRVARTRRVSRNRSAARSPRTAHVRWPKRRGRSPGLPRLKPGGRRPKSGRQSRFRLRMQAHRPGSRILRRPELRIHCPFQRPRRRQLPKPSGRRPCQSESRSPSRL